MNRIRRLLIMILGLCSFHLFGQVEDEYALQNQLIIQLSAPIEHTDITLPVSAFLKETLSKNMHIYLLESPLNFTQKEMIFLRQQKEVLKVQYNHKVQSRSIVPNDPFFSLQWNMHNDSTSGGAIGADIQALDAWMLNSTITTAYGDTIVIAIIEDPMDLHHEDLNYFINYHEIDSNGIDDDGNGYIDDYRGWNAFDNKGNTSNSFISHGIHVAGIATAIKDNGVGIAGVASGFKMLPIDGSSDDEAVVIKAYDYVLNMRKLYDATSGAKGAYIVATNASFGVGSFGAQPSNFPIWCGIYDSLGKVGILNMAAAPNANVNVDLVGDVPSGCPSNFIISVTNTTNNDTKSSGAAFGPTTIDIGAPGAAIYSTFPNNTYGLLTGTSMSTPHVTGTIGQLFAVACPDLLDAYAAYPDSITSFFKRTLLNGAERINSMNTKVSSNGRLNLYRSMLGVKSYNCNGCNFSVTDSISELSCYQSATAKIQINTASNLRYIWNTGDTTAQLQNISSGQYSVTIKDGSNCTQFRHYFLDEPQPIKILAINIIPINGNNTGNIIVVATAGNDPLLYALDGGIYQQTAAFATQVEGQHTLSIKNQYGCVRDTVVYIGNNTGINNFEDKLVLVIYPQPAKNEVNIIYSQATIENGMITIYDVQGRLALTEKPSNTLIQKINLEGIVDGLYVLKISTDEKVIAHQKIMVIH